MRTSEKFDFEHAVAPIGPSEISDRLLSEKISAGHHAVQPSGVRESRPLSILNESAGLERGSFFLTSPIRFLEARVHGARSDPIVRSFLAPNPRATTIMNHHQRAHIPIPISFNPPR